MKKNKICIITKKMDYIVPNKHTAFIFKHGYINDYLKGE